MTTAERKMSVKLEKEAFAQWLCNGGVDAIKMMLHNRLSIVLAVSERSTEKLSPGTTWVFDGAGLSRRQVTERRLLYHSATSEEFFSAVAGGVLQFVGTTPENFLLALRFRLRVLAKNILRLGNVKAHELPFDVMSDSERTACSFLYYDMLSFPKDYH